MENTPNLNLKKPSQDDDYNVDEFNDNADILDTEVGQLKTDVEEIKEELDGGVGDYTAPTIANAPTITSISDTASIPVSAADKTLNRVTFGNFKAVLRAVFDLIYAPKNHASTGQDFGPGTATNYGHVKVINNTTTAQPNVGEVLSAYQGKVLQDQIDGIDDRLDDGIMVAEIGVAVEETSMNGIDIIPKVVGGVLKKTTWDNAVLPFTNHNKSVDSMIDSMNEEIARHALILAAQGEIVSNGNDNLEYFGIRNQSRLNALNNHSDFGVLAADSVPGVSQITVINASGYRFLEIVDNSNLFTPIIRYINQSKSALLANGKMVYSFIRNTAVGSYTTTSLISYNPSDKTATVVRTNNDGLGRIRSLVAAEEFNIYGMLSLPNGSGGSGYLSLINDNLNITFNNTGVTYSPSMPFYCDVDKCFYFLSYINSSPYYTILCKSGVVNDSTNSLVMINARQFTTTQADTSYLYHCYKEKGKKYAIGYSTQQNGYIFILNNGYTQFTKISLSPNVTSIGGIIKIANKYVILNNTTDDISTTVNSLLYYPENSIGEMDTNAPSTQISIPFQNGRIIMNIWENNNVIYLAGTDGLLGYSTDGVNWTEIIINDDTKTNSLFAVGMTDNNGTIGIPCAYGSSLSSYGVAVYQSFNPNNYKNKRYRIDNEFVTVTDVSLSGDDIVLNLLSVLQNTHSEGALMQRTTDSTIKPNSNQTVCIDLQNLYSHDELAAVPTFTSLGNVTVLAEACAKNSLNEIEEWLPMQLVTELDSEGWKKQRWHIAFDVQKRYFAIAFTVTNENEAQVELNNLVGAVADKTE